MSETPRPETRLEIFVCIVLAVICAFFTSPGFFFFGSLCCVASSCAASWLWRHMPAFTPAELKAFRALLLVAFGLTIIPIALTISYTVCMWILRIFTGPYEHEKAKDRRAWDEEI